MLILGCYLTIAVAGWLTINALHGREAGPGTRSFAAFGIIIGLWSLGELLMMGAQSPEHRIHARRVFFLGAAGLPPAWFWLSARSAGPSWYAKRPWLVAAAFAAPAFFYSCLYWDRGLRFVSWDSPTPIHGPLFDLFMAHQYFLSVAGACYFVRTAIRLGRSSVPVMSALIVGVAMPLLCNLTHYFALVETDWTAVALGPSAFLIWLSVVESGLTSGLPIDHNEVIEQLDVGVVVADPEGRIISANEAAERLADTRTLLGRLLPEAVAAAEQRPDAYIESRGIALRGRFGIIGHALILNDRTEAETSRRRLELGGRLEALGSLTAGIAHEVNNPLAFIQANLSSLETTAKELAQDESAEALSPALKEAVADMAALVEETQEGVERIRLLVARLKSFSRTPDLEATAVEVDLLRSVRQAAAVAAIGQPGTPFSIDGGSSLRVLTIETALFQILVNLLLNAVQACPDDPHVRGRHPQPRRWCGDPRGGLGARPLAVGAAPDLRSLLHDEGARYGSRALDQLRPVAPARRSSRGVESRGRWSALRAVATQRPPDSSPAASGARDPSDLEPSAVA